MKRPSSEEGFRWVDPGSPRVRLSEGKTRAEAWKHEGQEPVGGGGGGDWSASLGGEEGRWASTRHGSPGLRRLPNTRLSP